MLRTLITLGVGILLAVAAVVLMNSHIQTRLPRSAQAQSGLQVTKVVVATKDIGFGQEIRRDNLKLVDWPATAIPDGIFHSIDDVFDGSNETRVAMRQIVADEPLMAKKVSGHGDRPILSAKLDETKRAYSIRVNDVSGVSGFLLPGDRVDVLLTRDKGSGKEDQVTDLILQDLLVLGIDQLSDEQREKPAVARTATVEVDPRQAQKLALAQEVGTLSLALRAVNSADKVNTGTIRVADLTQQQPRRVVPQGPTVTVRRGIEKDVYHPVREE